MAVRATVDVDEDATLAAAARALARRFHGAAPELTFERIRPRAAPMAAAVDGSSAVLLDGGRLQVVAWRAAVAWHENGATRAETGPLHARVIDGRGDGDLDTARADAEFAAARDAAQRLPEGGLLLLDGIVVPPHAAHISGDTTAVAAVAKSSSYAVDGIPVLAAARRAARLAGLDAPWAARIPGGTDRYAVRLSAGQEHVFLVDVLRGDPGEVLGSLAGLGNNAGVPGYPYVLALAHQAAVLGEEEQRDATAELLRLAGDAGADVRELELAFHDYHEDLDLGA